MRRAAPPGTDRCPRCDAAFDCGVATGGCWCAQVTLAPELQARLAARYEGCLCPACLRELASAGLASDDVHHRR